jgi:hypothetical protein
MKFIIENWALIITAVAAIFALLFVAFRGNKSIVMEMLVAMVTVAEKEYGSGTGALKLASVMEQIYPKLPAIIKTFISSKTLISWIESALKKAKEKWESNPSIAEYIAPEAEQGDTTRAEISD